MTTRTLTVAEFVLHRIGEDEAVALAAIDPDRPGTHWHWVRNVDDVPVKDPAVDTADEFSYDLRTVEEFPTTSGVGDLPAFVLSDNFPGESLGLTHIARHDPARVLAQCAALRAVVALSDWEGEKTTLREHILGPAADEAFRQGVKRSLRHIAIIWRGHPDFEESWLR